MTSEIRIDTEIVAYRNRWGCLFDDAVTFLPSGHRGRYVRWRWNAPYSVAVLTLVDKGCLLLSNFRHAARANVLEVVKGFAQDGMTPEETARAEAEEELGFTALELRYVTTVVTDPALDAHPMHCFIARGSVTVAPRREPSETVSDTVLLPLSHKTLSSIHDSVTLSLLALALLDGEESA